MTTTVDIPELGSYVAGEWRHGERRAPDTNPAHPSEVIANYALADRDLATQAIAAASAAAAAWRATPAPARGDVLRKAAALLDARA
jgi:aldehyde dehydrogenase (NAD+)